MALILKSSYNLYKHVFTTLKDPRSENYPMIGESPSTMLTILFGYIVLCKYGPVYMENKKAFQLRSLMTIYNFVQVVCNAICGSYGVYMLWIKYRYNFACQPIDYSTTEHGLAEMNLTYVYFLLKLLDLMDTVFIVLKKKNSQLSFLHCYHHGGMFFGTYVSAKWFCGGSLATIGLINAFVHAIMYSYYYITAFKPELKKSLWWKKYITQVQLIQFGIIWITYVCAAFMNCGFPKFISWVLIVQSTFMLTLFGDFYVKAYIKPNKNKYN